ncbi:hypothetical protein [Chryseobacterium sp. sg2396]|uniref:hypothetical protein n=1 Tax=Chryseobacterium sp. sg2396 TaxID=3276280 RepID=UPI0036705652
MKKNVLTPLAVMILSFGAHAQVGVNTTTPLSTLEVAAKNTTGTSTNVDGFLFPRVDRQRAQSMANVPVSTMIYVNDASTGTAQGTAVNIANNGFYFFDGNVWVRLSEPVAPANTFVPSVVASGKTTNSVTLTDSSGFNKFTFTASTNDGNWSTTNNTYTTSKAGFYQLSMQAIEQPSTSNNSFGWVMTYDSNSYQYAGISNIVGGTRLNSGGVVVLYLNVNQVIRFGAIPCTGCGSTTYNVTDRSFSITYLGN